MYLAVDIGGTKTLVALLSEDGQIVEQRRFPSSHDYEQFLKDVKNNFEQLQHRPDSQLVGCVGVPGLLTRETGVVHALGNLPWREKPIRDDMERACNARLLIENDARLGGLSEAQLVKQYQYVVFLTVSTGIGGAFVHKGKLVTALQDTEMGKMPLFFNGQFTHWEEFAGGRGVVETFAKKASEIVDQADWKVIGERIAYGLGSVCSTLQPEAVILGGSVGIQADKYAAYIAEFLDRHLHPVVRRPEAILAAQRPEEAVIYGCYDLAKQRFANANAGTD